MVKQYIAVPTKNEWEKDMGFLDTFFAAKRFPAADEVAELLGLIATLDPNLPAEFFIRQQALAHIWMQTEWAVRWNARGKKEKLGGKMGDKQIDTMVALMNVCAGHLRLALGTDEAGLRAAITARFGRQVGADDKADDANKVAAGSIQWLDQAQRKALKLHFRNGQGMRNRMNGNQVVLDPYDTTAWGDGVEVGGANLYVMDRRGHLYVGGNQGSGEIKHSSFLQGDDTLAAGTMKWSAGRLLFITPMSGHYKPTLEQMLNVLQRLAAVQVPLGEVLFCRVNLSDAYIGKPKVNGKHTDGRPGPSLEPCNALLFLRTRKFPGAHPTAMVIGPTGNPVG